jgi:hypothetical protein
MNEKVEARLLELNEKGFKQMGNGNGLYWTYNELGCRVYYSDEVGGGVLVWDTTVVSPSTMLEAVVQENEFQHLEKFK